jgi:hypothetical protein
MPPRQQDIVITLEGTPIDTNTDSSPVILQRRPRLITRGIQLIQVIGLPVDVKFPSKTWRALQSELNRGASPRNLAAQLIW